MTKRIVLVIFGASSSIGMGLVERVDSEIDVILVSRKWAGDSFISRPGIQAFAVSDYSFQHLEPVFSAIEQYSDASFLFLNGVAESVAFYKLDEEFIKEVLSVNLCLPISLTNELIKRFVRKKLTFIYSSSSRALMGDVGISVYSASKVGLVNFAKCMALEYGRLGHQFVVLSLGLFEGGLNHLLTERQRVKIFNRSAAPTFVSLDELWNSMKFAIQNRSVNGSVLKVDNGYF